MKATPESLLHPDESVERFVADNYAVGSHDSSSDLSFPDLNVPESGYGTGTTLRFIFWVHTPVNQTNVIPLIEGCDILVMESVENEIYTNVIERQKQDIASKLTLDLLNIVVTGQVDPKVARRLSRRGVRAEDYTELPDEERKEQIARLSSDNHVEILTYYAGKLEKVFEVDTELRDAERLAELDNTVEENLDRFEQSINDFDCSWVQLRGYALSYLQAHAEVNEFREAITAKQLEQIVRKNPGKKIAVLYGRGHQPLTRLVEMPGVRLQRQFADVTDEEVKPIQKKFSQLISSIENSLRIGTHSQDQLDQLLVLFLVLDLKDQEKERMASKMTPEQLPAVAAKLRELWGEPIDLDGDYDDLDTPERMVQQRREQTLKIIKTVGVARQLPSFLRRRS
jgi:hypothetical protein